MIMSPRLRKFALAAHVTFSVGWIGAVAAFVILSVAGLARPSAQVVRAAYLAMEPITWFVIIPMAFASLLTGIVSSLGTRWGLFRYYWVVVKLLITILSTIILLVHVQPIETLAGAAAKTSAMGADYHSAQILMVTASCAALVALLVLTVLSVYKPRGVTPYGSRKQQKPRAPS